MNCRVFFLAIALSVGLAACGGGGGNPGATSGEVPPVVVLHPTVSMVLLDKDLKETATRNLSQTDTQYLRVGLKDAAGVAVANTRVTMSLDTPVATLVPASGLLTDTGGFAQFRIAPTSVTSTGPVLVTAVATVSGEELKATLDLMVSSGSVELKALTVAPLTVQKFQSVNVSVGVEVNGSPAPSNSVAVEFTSNCGAVAPASSIVDSSGHATAIVQTDKVGDCTVNATSVGKTIRAGFFVTDPPIAGLQFIGASPSVIYQLGSPGANTSRVTFKVVDSLGGLVPGIAVAASLTNTDGGINFCNSPSTATSDVKGEVVFSVCGGTLPATVQVRGTLVSMPSVYADSNVLTIQTGLPTQRFLDISTTAHNFLVGGYFTVKVSGKTTAVNIYAADRQGNPVPDGTPVSLVAEGGQLNTQDVSSCILKNGGCSVELIGQDYRPMGSNATDGDPRPGRVTVLAFMDGEEYFVDANFNNRYDDGELFEDLGTPYLDKDESKVFAASYKNLVTLTDEGEVTYPVPASAVGTKSCPTNSSIGLSASGTCNGKWDRLTKVRRGITLIFSGPYIAQPGSYHESIPEVFHTKTLSASKSAVTVLLSDHDGNPLPADAKISVEVIKPEGDQCEAKIAGEVIGSTTEPTIHTAVLQKCIGGGVETVQFVVEVDKYKSSYSVVVP